MAITKTLIPQPAGSVALETGDTVKVECHAQARRRCRQRLSIHRPGLQLHHRDGLRSRSRTNDSVRLLGGYLRGGDAGSLYKYAGDNATLDPSASRTMPTTTSKWTIVKTDLSAEDYSDNLALGETDDHHPRWRSPPPWASARAA